MGVEGQGCYDCQGGGRGVRLRGGGRAWPQPFRGMEAMMGAGRVPEFSGDRGAVNHRRWSPALMWFTA